MIRLAKSLHYEKGSFLTAEKRAVSDFAAQYFVKLKKAKKNCKK